MTTTQMFIADKSSALEILDMKEEGKLSGKILRVSNLEQIKNKFDTYSDSCKLDRQKARNLDTDELRLALNQGWITYEAVTDEVMQKLKTKNETNVREA